MWFWVLTHFQSGSTFPVIHTTGCISILNEFIHMFIFSFLYLEHSFGEICALSFLQIVNHINNSIYLIDFSPNSKAISLRTLTSLICCHICIKHKNAKSFSWTLWVERKRLPNLRAL